MFLAELQLKFVPISSITSSFLEVSGMKNVSLVPFLALLVGCATTSNLNSNYTLNNLGTQSVVVLGVQPDYRVRVDEGNLENGAFKFNSFASGKFSVTPVDGYIIATLDATPEDKRYAITYIFDTHHLMTHAYTPCANTTPTFSVPPGSVVYLGNYTFNESADGLSRAVSYDEKSVKAYLDQHYPGLASLPFISQHAVDMHVIGEPCGTPIFIPIPIN